MSIAEDFKGLLPKREASKPDKRPVYFLWTYDPTDAKIYIAHNENRHPADALTHQELAPHVQHPDRLHGYAYSIGDGWRITDADHKEVTDKFILKRVLAALRKESPPPPLPSIRYHGAP